MNPTQRAKVEPDQLALTSLQPVLALRPKYAAIYHRSKYIFRNLSTASQLKKNIFSGILNSGTTSVLMAVSYPIYLRYLGYQQYGLWLVLATVLTFAQLSNLGLGQAVSRQVASYHATQNNAGVDSCVSTALCTLIVTGGLSCSLIALFRNSITDYFHLSAANATSVSALLPAVGILSFYAVYLDTLSSTLAGLGRIDLYNYFQVISQTASVITTLFLLHSHYGLRSFAIGSALGYFVLHLLTGRFLRRIAGRKVFRLKSFSTKTLSEILRISVYLTGCSVLGMLVGPLNKIFLARYTGVSVLPTYDIIVNGSMKVRSLVETGIRALMPEISRLAATSEKAKIAVLNQNIFRKVLVGGLAVYGFLFCFSGLAIRLWLGQLAEHFPVGALRVVLFGTFFSMLSVPAYYTLLGLGKSANLFISALLQSMVPFFTVGVILFSSRPLSLSTVLGAVAGGMITATVFLVWQSSRATRHSGIDVKAAQNER